MARLVANHEGRWKKSENQESVTNLAIQRISLSLSRFSGLELETNAPSKIANFGLLGLRSP